MHVVGENIELVVPVTQVESATDGLRVTLTVAVGKGLEYLINIMKKNRSIFCLYSSSLLPFSLFFFFFFFFFSSSSSFFSLD